MTHPTAVAGTIVRRVRQSAVLRALARSGLVARGVFMLLLAVLTARLALGTSSGAQSNANGALQEVARSGPGLVLVALAALTFGAYAVVRMAGALTDDREGVLRRVSTGGQALFWLASAVVAARFALGVRSSGSEQAQQSSVRVLLGLPAGRLIVLGIGITVLSVCTWQLVVAAKAHFADSLHLEGLGPRAQHAVLVLGRVALPARALSTAPVGVLLIVSAAQSDASEARGPDALLRSLTGSGPGRVVVGVVAVGFAVYALFSLVEARYRAVSAGA